MVYLLKMVTFHGYVSHKQMVEKWWLGWQWWTIKTLDHAVSWLMGLFGFSHRGILLKVWSILMVWHLACYLFKWTFNMHCTSACVYNDVELLVFHFSIRRWLRTAMDSSQDPVRWCSVTIRYQSGSKSKSSVPGKTWLNDHWAHQKSKVSSWHGKTMKDILRSEAKNLAKSCINLPRSGMTLELSCDLKQHCQAAQDI